MHTIRFLPNISRSKSNETIKFGQSTKYNMKKFFLKKSYTNGGGEAST